MKLVNFFKAALTMLTIIVAASCTDLAGIEDRLDSLESDVKALQGQLAAVNQNFETLESLKGAIVISDVEEIQNGYKLTLSNGEVLNLTLVVDEPKEEKPEILGAIEINQNEVKITLADGTVVSVPVVENFKFAIKLNGEVVTEKQEFTKGEAVEYDVEQSNVASAAVVACPDGFSVELQENKLIVSTVITFDVNSTPATKATASSDNEIAILAVSKNGHSVLSKLEVNLAEAVVPEGPVAKVKLTGTEIAFNRATFAVELTDATEYAYICLPATEEAPTLEALTALEAKTDAEFTVENLNADTSYKIYVVAKNEETGWGPVISVPFKTSVATSYELYNAGIDVVVGNVTINKAGYGEATLITKESDNKEIESVGVYFVDADAEGVNIKADAEKLVVLSVDERIATINRAGQTAFNATAETDYFILSNVKYVTNQTSGNVFGAKGEGDFETILFNNVKIEVPADMNMIYSPVNILNFNMTDCDVKLHAGSTDKNILQTNTTNTYASVVFKNNIFYSTDGARSNFKLFANDNATITWLEVKNNTIADLYTKANYGYISCKFITSGEIFSNLFYLPTYSEQVLDGGNVKYCGIIRMPKDTDDTGVSIKSNLAFYNYDAVPGVRMKSSFYRNDASGELYNKGKVDNPIPNPDYVNGVFTAVDKGDNKFSTFGAKR